MTQTLPWLRQRSQAVSPGPMMHFVLLARHAEQAMDAWTRPLETLEDDDMRLGHISVLPTFPTCNGHPGMGRGCWSLGMHRGAKRGVVRGAVRRSADKESRRSAWTLRVPIRELSYIFVLCDNSTVALRQCFERLSEAWRTRTADTQYKF